MHSKVESAVVPNGVDLQPFRPGSGEGIVYVGRLIRTKGVDELLAAIRQLPGVHLTVVGDGPERERLEHEARGLPVTFAGQVDHATARQHIRNARCLALPSHTEAYPNVILEAMASGVPVVATRTGGIPSLVQDGKTGFLVTPAAWSELIGALAKLTHDEALCLQMGARAHEAARSYAWPCAAKRLVDQIELVRGQRVVAAPADSS